MFRFSDISCYVLAELDLVVWIHRKNSKVRDTHTCAQTMSDSEDGIEFSERDMVTDDSESSGFVVQSDELQSEEFSDETSDMSDIMAAFRMSVLVDDVQRVDRLLKGYGRHIDLERRTRNGYTALLRAAHNCSLRMFRKLVDFGAHVDAVSLVKQNTALTIAIRSYDESPFKKAPLFIAMAEAGIDINGSCCCGERRIKSWMRRWDDHSLASEQLVRLLIACGARPHQLRMQSVEMHGWICVPPGVLIQSIMWRRRSLVHTVCATQPELLVRFQNIAISARMSEVQRRYALRQINCVRLGFIRWRVFEICIALQMLRFPAMITLQIVDQMNNLAELVPMHLKWNIIVAVKHFKQF